MFNTLGSHVQYSLPDGTIAQFLVLVNYPAIFSVLGVAEYCRSDTLISGYTVRKTIYIFTRSGAFLLTARSFHVAQRVTERLAAFLAVILVADPLTV